MKKWYIFERSAEGRALFFVELTAKEFQTVRNFLDCQKNGPDQGYTGIIELSTHRPFQTKIDAEIWAKKFHSLIYAYDKSAEGL